MKRIIGRTLFCLVPIVLLIYSPCFFKPLFWPAVYSYGVGQGPESAAIGDLDGDGALGPPRHSPYLSL